MCYRARGSQYLLPTMAEVAEMLQINVTSTEFSPLHEKQHCEQGKGTVILEE